MPILFESGTIRILGPDGITTAGTGFLVSKRLAVTCAHVIHDVGSTVQIQFAGQENTISAQIIAEHYYDSDNGDIAFLRLDNTLENATPFTLGTSEHSLSGNSFQAFGYPRVGKINGVHARGEILGIVTENKQKLIQLRSMELNQGHSGAPVWDDKRNIIIGMVVSVYKSDISGKLRDTAFAIPSETLWQVYPDIRPSEVSPYLKLEAFTEETSQFFFGRDAFTKKLLHNLSRGNRFLALFGPSGSGKSSVVRAGLLPSLKSGQLPNSDKWIQIIMRPVDNPFKQMQISGLNSFEISEYLKAHKDAERVVLFIDQFEELFTLCAKDIQDRFTAELATALETSKLILILSIRDDFYSTFNASAIQLAESEHIKIENMPGMLKREELIEIIEKPANIVKLTFEKGLSESLLKDLSYGGKTRSTILPLLEFTLTRLWEKRSDGRFTHEAYQIIGGVTGSLALWADDAYSELTELERDLAREIFTSLVHLGNESQGLPYTRRRRTMTELATSGAALHVVNHFVEKRLIVTSGETVELIHDALISEWSKLNNWLKENRDDLRLREGVSEAAQAWKADYPNTDLLIHRGGRLEYAFKLRKQFNSQEKEYIDSCRIYSRLEQIESLIDQEVARLEFDEKLNKLFELMQQIVPFEAAAFCFIENETIAYFHSIGFELLGIHINEIFKSRSYKAFEILKNMYESKELVVILDTKNVEFFGMSSMDNRNGSILGSPLVIDNTVIGFLFLYSHTQNFYDLFQTKIFSRFVNRISKTLINAQEVQRAENERRKRDELLQAAQETLRGQLGEIENLQDELKTRIYKDTVTDMYTLQYIRDKLELEISQFANHSEPICIAVIGIDTNHQFIDNPVLWEYKAGDIFGGNLKTLLSKHTQKKDIFGRYGDNKFCVILPGTPKKIAFHRAEVWRKNFSKVIVFFKERKIKTTISIGIAIYPDDGLTCEDLIDLANLTMFEAQKIGGNRVVFAGNHTRK